MLTNHVRGHAFIQLKVISQEMLKIPTVDMSLEINKFSCISRMHVSLSGVPDYFGRNKISSGGDPSHYSSASLY